MKRFSATRFKAVLDTVRDCLLACFFILSLQFDTKGAYVLQILFGLYILGTSYLRYRLWKRKR